MEKRLFNKIIKQQMLSYGFEKVGPSNYVKEAEDGITKIIVCSPEEGYYFRIAVQFKDFDKDYSDYSGKFSKRCMLYSGLPQRATFNPFNPYDCTEAQIVEDVKNMIEHISPLLQRGRERVREELDLWMNTIISEVRENDIYAYFGMPLINPYSDSYILKDVEENYKCGVKSMMSLEEYYNHKEHYDKYIDHGCQIDIGKEFVTISYKSKR